MKIAYIISYDIANERRLNRIHNYLKGQGVHLQKSVFYCLLSRERLKKIQAIENYVKSKDQRLEGQLQEADGIV